jgi:hypothetical protein
MATLTGDGRADARAWRLADQIEADNDPAARRDACGMRGCAARAAGRTDRARLVPGGARPGSATGAGLLRRTETEPFLRELRAAADIHGGWVAGDLHATNSPRAFPIGRWGLWKFSAAWAIAAPINTLPGVLAEIASTIFESGPDAAGYVIDSASPVGVLVPAGATGPERRALAIAARDVGIDGLPVIPFAAYYG